MGLVIRRLVSRPSHPKIEMYQGESLPCGALCVSCITGPTGQSIRQLGGNDG